MVENLKNHFLRFYRQKMNLKQSDIASLLDMENTSLLCKIEYGKRSPNLNVILMYHILLDVPIQELFPRHYLEMKKLIIDGIDRLIPILQESESYSNKESIKTLKKRQGELLQIR